MAEMNIYEITKRDLQGRNFAFKDGTEFLRKGFQGQPFIFDGLLLIACTGGTARIKINYQKYPVAANDICIVLPKHIGSICECSPGFEALFLLISMDFLCALPAMPDFGLLKRVDVQPCARLSGSLMDDMLKLHSVISRHDGSNEWSRQIQDTLARAMLLLAMSSFGKLEMNPEKAYSRQESITRSFFNLLANSGGTERRVSSYANELCITPKHLTTVVKAVTGHPVQHWINEVALIESKRYLKTTELTIQQIADKLRFLTPSSFIRFFKAHAGCTPLEYRKMDEE